ncbi:MAG: ABC transporter substrate-binding protein, partial [Actinomycetota bacterium]
PWAAFEGEVAARFPIFPRHIWENVPDPIEVSDRKMLVGSGPYRLTDLHEYRGAYLFTANDDFWLGRPFVKRIQMQPFDSELTALRAGEIDGGEPNTGAPTRLVVPVFEKDGRFGIVKGRPDFFAALSWNLGRPGLASDPLFRKACAYAIDRRRIARRLLAEGEPGNPGFLPPGHPFHEEVEQYAHSPADADRLLDQAGYGRESNGRRRTQGGKDLRVRLLILPELAPAAEIVREDLEAVGISVHFEPTDLFSAIQSGALRNYEMALLFFGGLDRDPDLLREVFSQQTEGQGIFHSLGWRNQELEDLAERQQSELDDGRRRQMIGRMQQLIAEHLPILPLYYATPFFIYRRATFDQWSLEVEAKQVYVTGKADGQLPIRPTTA